MDGLIGLIKKKGFKDTIQVLSMFDDYRCEKHAFYNELNKFSYYNSFFRTKDNFINKGLIEIEQHNSKKFIKLTDKGLNVLNKLNEINQIINEK